MDDHANYRHPNLLAHNMNTEDIRQEDSHDDHYRSSLYEDINHPRCLSSQHSTEPDKYDGSSRVSLHKGRTPQ